MAAKAVKKERSFEDGLIHLEAIAEQMEKSDLPLEQLLAMYEEGMKLSSELTQKLELAKGRMQEVKQGAEGKPVIIKTDVTEQASLFGMLDEGE